jgi:hypothetical protein
MPIVAGKVIYSRTIQVAQFEPRRVEVEISFEVHDGEILADLLDDAKNIAREEALDLVSIRDR